VAGRLAVEGSQCIEGASKSKEKVAMRGGRRGSKKTRIKQKKRKKGAREKFTKNGSASSRQKEI